MGRKSLCSCVGWNLVRSLCYAIPFASQRALPTETKVERGMSQSKSGAYIKLSNSGKLKRCIQTFCGLENRVAKHFKRFTALTNVTNVLRP